jgi:hypothetical protein
VCALVGIYWIQRYSCTDMNKIESEIHRVVHLIQNVSRLHGPSSFSTAFRKLNGIHTHTHTHTHTSHVLSTGYSTSCYLLSLGLPNRLLPSNLCNCTINTVQFAQCPWCTFTLHVMGHEQKLHFERSVTLCINT